MGQRPTKPVHGLTLTSHLRGNLSHKIERMSKELPLETLHLTTQNSGMFFLPHCCYIGREMTGNSEARASCPPWQKQAIF